MTIVCGTDFSVPASGAVRAAAAIAARRGETLRLVHVQGDFAPIEEGAMGTDRPRDALFDLARALLHDEAARARALGAEVVEEMAVGDPAFQILAAAARSEASLVVVAWLGRTAPSRWIVGSVAEKIARASAMPVLVVRDPEPLVAWARGERPLPISVADDLGESSLGALRWAATTARAIGAVEVTTVHVASPSEEHARRRLHVSADLEHLRPEVDAAIRGDLRARSAAAGLEGPNVVIQQGFGRVDPHVVSLADQAGSELLVVGTHRRAGLGRLWHGSVSRGVLFLTTQNVVCAPSAPPEGLSTTPPTYRSILVATDLSEVGDAAVPHAFAVAPPGATVHVLHVVPELEARVPMADRAGSAGTPGPATSVLDDAALSLALARRVPRDVAARGVEVRCHVVHGGVTAEILAVATRVGADLVCLGSHGRTGLTAALLGSVAREVMARSPRPVLVVGASRAT